MGASVVEHSRTRRLEWQPQCESLRIGCRGAHLERAVCALMEMQFIGRACGHGLGNGLVERSRKRLQGLGREARLVLLLDDGQEQQVERGVGGGRPPGFRPRRQRFERQPCPQLVVPSVQRTLQIGSVEILGGVHLRQY